MTRLPCKGSWDDGDDPKGNEFPRSSTYAIVSSTFFEGPPHGRFVADRRHGAVLLRLVEQRPFAGECASSLELFRIDRQQARLLRAVKVQTARVIPVAHPHANDTHISHNLLVDSECRSRLRLVEVFVDRQRCLREQREAAGAGAAFKRARADRVEMRSRTRS